MALPVTWNADFDYPPAFAGMLADDMFTDKVTVPCGATTQAFGTVVATVAATGISVFPHAANPIVGVAIHDHRFAGRVTTQEGYVQYDAISVITRGRVWCLASGACTKDAVAKFTAATGAFSDAGLVTLPNARFLSAMITVPGVESGTQTIVLVELHHPQV